MTIPLTIRASTPADVTTIFSLIQALADYEKLSQLFKQDPSRFELETRTAVDEVIADAKSVKSKSNLLKLQVKLARNLCQA